MSAATHPLGYELLSENLLRRSKPWLRGCLVCLLLVLTLEGRFAERITGPSFKFSARSKALDCFTDYELRTRVQDWMLLLEQHDLGLYRHSIAVGDLVLRFSAHLGYSPSDCLRLQTAGILHDIGKLKVSQSILQKPGNLALDEITLMQHHAHDGYHMLVSQAEYSQDILDVVRDHHERLDGTGYPHGIAGAAISTEVRMVTLCDVYMAMTECRPYGIRYNSLGALERMTRKGGRLDQRLVNAFGEMILQIDASEAAYRISYSVTDVQVKTRY